MPLARIITHSAEAAAQVVKQLKARGYTVETISPGESCDKPADLEIVLEKVNSDAVLSRVTDLVQATNGNVYIGAGTFRARRVEVPARESQIARSLPVPSVEDTVNGVAAGLQNKRDLLAKALWEQRANMREARRLQRERVRQEQMRLAAEAERLRIDQEERARVRAAAEAERQRVAEIAARENAERAERERAKQLEAERERAEQSERQQAEQAERERILAEHAEADRLFREEEAHVAQQDTVESVEPAEVHDVPVLAQEAEDAQLAPAASVESTFAEDVVVPGFGSREQRQDVVVPVEVTGSHVAAAPPPVSGSERHGSGHRPRLRLPHRDSGRGPVRARAKEWRAAVIVSSIFALVLMLAWRVVTRGPVSPFPAGVTNQTNLQQEVPFGGVTLTPPGSNLPGTLAPASHPDGKVLRPIPADLHGIVRPQRTSTEDSAGQAVADKHVKPTAAQEDKKAKPSVNRRSRLHRHSEDEIAEDEVIIRHFAPKPASPPAEQKASLKKYSDLD